MTMEYKRTAVWQAATRSGAGLWLGVSKLRSGPTLRYGASLRVSEIHSDSALRLIVGYLEGRSLSSDLKLAHPAGVLTPEASSRLSTVANCSGQTARPSSLRRRTWILRVPDSSRFVAKAKGGETVNRCGYLLASNQPPLPGISNREHQLLGLLPTYRKQTTAHDSNRELSTNRYTSNCHHTGRRQRKFPPVTGDPGERLFGFLTGTDLQQKRL